MRGWLCAGRSRRRALAEEGGQQLVEIVCRLSPCPASLPSHTLSHTLPASNRGKFN